MHWIRTHRVLACCCLVALVICAPFVTSRILSSARVVQVVEEADLPPRLASNEPIVAIAYNIAHGRGLATSNWSGGSAQEREARLDDIVKTLQRYDPDVLILNEVDFHASWSFGVNQAAYLAERLAMPYRVEQRNIDARFIFSTWKFGNAILSKYPIRDAQLIDLPAYASWEAILAGKKRAVQADIVIGDQSLSVIAVHLSHRSEQLRVDSSQIITEHVAGIQGDVIIGGDFNSTPHGMPGSMNDSLGRNAMDYFEEHLGYRRLIDDGRTFPSDKPQRTIDWFLMSESINIVDKFVIDSTLSDHKPIYVKMNIPQ